MRHSTPNDSRPGAYPLGGSPWLIWQVDTRNRHGPLVQHRPSLCLRLEHPCRACGSLPDPVSNLGNAKAVIEPLDKDRLQASQRRLRKLSRVLPIAHSWENTHGYHRSSSFLGPCRHIRDTSVEGDRLAVGGDRWT
jgi:hypothetical protein